MLGPSAHRTDGRLSFPYVLMLDANRSIRPSTNLLMIEGDTDRHTVYYSHSIKLGPFVGELLLRYGGGLVFDRQDRRAARLQVESLLDPAAVSVAIRNRGLRRRLANARLYAPPRPAAS